jgi:hypothetical protein
MKDDIIWKEIQDMAGHGSPKDVSINLPSTQTFILEMSPFLLLYSLPPHIPVSMIISGPVVVSN